MLVLLLWLISVRPEKQNNNGVSVKREEARIEQSYIYIDWQSRNFPPLFTVLGNSLRHFQNVKISLDPRELGIQSCTVSKPEPPPLLQSYPSTLSDPADDIFELIN